MIPLIQYTLLFASVLTLVALGGCYAEHSGVINLGLEGIMVMGAFGGALALKSFNVSYANGSVPAIVVVLAAVVASMLSGMIYSCLLGIACINFKADQTLVGTALNMLATAVATIIAKTMNTIADPDNVSATVSYVNAKKALLVYFGRFEVKCFMAIVIAFIIAWFLLYKRRFGFFLMACRKHPEASESVGNIVERIRWYVGLICLFGMLGGLVRIVYFTDGEWKFEFNWFIAIAVIALIIAYVLLYKTRFGLRLMACGEHPQAADSVGISVNRMRWSGVLISGMFGGLGGIVYITAGVSEWKFEYGVAGFGFLSLAVMIFGQWKPHMIALSAILFGFFRAFSNVYTGFAFFKQLNLPSTFYNMLPYIISLIVLAFTSMNSRAPKAEGIPYDKSAR